MPNNTFPDGSITRALEGLISLSEELAENSSIDDPFTSWMKNWFGRWQGLVTMARTSHTCGCCCIPCLHGLLQKLIYRTLTKTMYQQVKDEDGEGEEDMI